tara:strand:- start:2900 stop:4216 length:1317 start_codon:yes stop_codon:yes gene_type:complete
VERIVIPYTPRAAFKPLHKRTQRWACVVAHRRAGKTVACVNELIKAALTDARDGQLYAYVAPFYTQAKGVAWDYLKSFSRPIPGIKVNEAELRIDYPNGNRVQLFGADNADRMRGLAFSGLVADEFGDWKPSVWGYVIRPALADRRGWAIIIGTPKGRNQFCTAFERARSDTDWLAMMLKASETGLLPPDEIAALQKELTEDAYRQEMECDFEAALLGAFYGKEMRQAMEQGRITEVTYDDAVPVYTAWDLGYKDDTAIWWYQVVRGEVHVLEYYAVSGADIATIAGVVASKPYRYGRHWLPHDARAKTLAAAGKSIVEQLGVHLGISTLAIVPDLSVQDGIQAVRQMLPRTWFDEGCDEGLEALRQYQREFDEDKKAFRQTPRHDWTSHPADAFRMLAIAWRGEAKDEPAQKGKTIQTITINELWEHHETHKEEARI